MNIYHSSLLMLLTATTCFSQQSDFKETPVAPVDPHIQPYEKPAVCPAGTIRILGAEAMAATTLQWTQDFAAISPSVHFVVKSGALDVIPALMDGSSDMASTVPWPDAATKAR
jgi:hypothetical protein